MRKAIGDWIGRIGLALILLLLIMPVASAQMELFWFTGVLAILCWIIPLIIRILLMIYVYRDAEKRGKSGVLWLIVVLLLGLIGVIIWLVVRPPEQMAPPPGAYPPPPGAYPPPPGGGYPPPPPRR